MPYSSGIREIALKLKDVVVNFARALFRFGEILGDMAFFAEAPPDCDRRPWKQFCELTMQR